MRTLASLTDDLHRLGIRAGDRVVVHSSLCAIAQSEGGGETLVRALLDVLGPDGLLVAPTFTYFSTRFDPRTEPGLTGRLAETIRTWPGAIRSWHPTHSVAAIGSEAAALCTGHHLVGGLTLDSPLDRLARQGGWVLLIGVGHVANSTIHVGEVHAGVPFLDLTFRPDSPTQATVVTGREETLVPFRHPPGCSRAFGAVERPLRQRGTIRDGMIGGALSQLVAGRDVIESTVALLCDDPKALLCADPGCHRCTQARWCVEKASR